MMRTSATGAERRRIGGFTLVELLVVVTLMGLVSGAVILALPDRATPLRRDAERFAARLQQARDEAVLTGRTIEVSVSADGYAFAARDADGRHPLAPPAFGPTRWSPTVRLATTAARDMLTFDPLGGATPAHVVLEAGQRRRAVHIGPNGEVRLDASR